MRTNFVQTCKTSANRINLNRITMRVALIGLFISLGIGNAWAARSSSAAVSVSVKTGSGTVYVSKNSDYSSDVSSSTNTTTATQTTTKSQKDGSQTDETFYIKAVPNTDYRLTSWVFGGTWKTQPASETKASSQSGVVRTKFNGTNTGTAQATFVQISIASATPTSVTLNPTNASASCGDYTGTVTFTTTNDNAAAQIGTPTFGSTTGSGTWTASNTWVAGTSTVNYTFKGNGYYGGSGTASGSRNNSATLTLPTAGGTSSKSVTFTANFPDLELGEGSTSKVYPVTPTTTVDGTATFPVQYCDGAFDFNATITGASGGTWTPGAITVAITDAATGSGTVTVPFSFNAGGATGDFSATLTLTPVANTGGSAQSVTVTAYAEQVYDYDVEVYNASDVKISDNTTTWAQGLTLANANAGSTIKLMRNVNLGELSASQEIKNNVTLDLNGKTLSASLKASNTATYQRMFLLNTANKTFTITDSKTGGTIDVTANYANQKFVVYVAKANSHVVQNGGTLRITNNTTDNNDRIFACGVYLVAGATFEMNGGTIESTKPNKRNAYGVYAESNATTPSVFTMNRGTIDVSAYNWACAIRSRGTVNVHPNAIIKANTTGAATSYGIYMDAVASTTDASSYAGELNMTGGEIISTTKTSSACGILIQGVTSSATASATDGTHSNKATAKCNITGGTIKALPTTTTAYGVLIQGDTNSKTREHVVAQIKNATIIAEGEHPSGSTNAANIYGVYVHAICDTARVGLRQGDAELTNCTITATAKKGQTAYAVYVHAFQFSKLGDPYKEEEVATAGKVTINSGTYTANTTTGRYAYAVCSATRVKSILGKAEAYPTIIIHDGKFTATTGTTTARAVSAGGHTTIDGGEFIANAGSSDGYGIYHVAGKLKVSGVKIKATAPTNARGVSCECAIHDYTGYEYHSEAELNNLNDSAITTTGATAYGVVATAANKLETQERYDTYMAGAANAVTKSYYDRVWSMGPQLTAAKVTINGGTFTAIGGTTTAYAAYCGNPSITTDVSAWVSPTMEINNATLIAKTNGTTTAYGVYSGGTTTVNNCDITVKPMTTTGYGVFVQDNKTTVNNTKITVTTSNPDNTKSAAAYGFYVNAAINYNTSKKTGNNYLFQGELVANEGNDVTVSTTSGTTAYGIYVHAAKVNIPDGDFIGDYAYAGKATVNGGKYTATASGTTAYAACVADPVLQGEATATPTLIINGGKFKGTAGATPFADVSLAGEPGYFVLNGGYYVKDENLDKKLGEGMNKVAVKSGTPEYTEGYRWRVTDNMTGEYVCKIKENSTSYASLEEALQVVNATPNSTWTIIMIANYTLSKGDYVLPANTTLLIPYQSGQTAINGATPKYTSPAANVEQYEAPTPLYKLTFANGVNMSVYGKIEASAVTYLSNQGLTSHGTGVVSGKYGWLYLNEGSHIDLESGSALYAWGYVTGKGEINAKNGSAVYEDFQMGDWRGGTAESNFLDNKTGLDKKGVFVITHYYYQNIECPITYRAGAQGMAHGGTYMYKELPWPLSTVDDKVPTQEAVKMIGTSGAMFLMDPATAGEDTWVRKEYDPETDYVNWTMNSGAQLGSVSIHMNLPMLGEFDVNSADYVLPITSNFNIVANYGEIDITNHVCFLPGSKLTIKKEGVVNIPSGQRVFFYDQDDWKSYGGYWFNPYYSPSWKVNPRVATIGDKTKVKMSDAEVLVEGLLNVNGAIYTTAGGANIHSTRENAGKVKFCAALPASTSAIATSVDNKGNTTTLFQITSAPDNKPSFEGKALNSAWLKNEDGSYSKPTSANTDAGDTWTYMQSLTEDTYEWTLASEDGCFTTRKTGDTKTYVHPSDWVAVGAVNANHAYPSEDGTRMFVNTEAASTSASCKWWDVNPTSEVIDAVTYYVANNENFDNFGTYYYWDNTTSYWKPKKITVTWQNEDGTKITNGTYGDLYSFNTSPQFHGTNPKKTSTAIEKYDWIGWRDAEGNIYDKNATLPRATSDVTYTAYFNTTKYQYTITFKNDDNSDLWAGLVDAGTTGAELQALFEQKYNEKTGSTVPQKAPTVDKVYTFDSWNTALQEVTGAATYTATYTWVTRKYHVTFYSYDAATVLYEADVDYNTTRPVYGGVTPFRSNTSAYSYEWTGWQQGATHYGTTDNLALVTGDVYYVATFDPTALKYQVLFKRQDGSIIDAPFFEYEETPSAFPANPTMASTVSTDYIFDHWDPATLTSVTEDGKVYTAYFSESPRQYTAHFVNFNGVSLNAGQTIDYNTVPAYTGVTPMKPNDSRNSYEFSGWAWAAGDGWEAGSVGVGETLPAIKGDITFTAQYNPVLLQFDVIYQREDGTVILRDKKKWGESSAFPTSGLDYEDATYSYTFDHWSPATVVNPVTADATYTAYYNQSIKTYSITAVGISPAGYGTVSPASLASIPGGSTVIVNGNTITVNGTTITATPAAADAQYTYTFDHWNNVPATVTGNVTNIEAVFTCTVNQYDVTFNMKGHGAAISSQTKDYGSKVDQPADPSEAGYTFVGWYKEDACTNAWNFASDEVTGATTLFAKWTINQYTITFDTGGGSAVASITQNYGTAVTPPANPTRTGYTFAGWLPDVPATMPVDGANCVAQWTINSYQIKFVDEDGTTNLGSYPQNLDYGAAVTAPEEPTKAADATNVYTFAGWSDGVNTYASADIPAVSGAVTYTATYSSEPTVASVTVGGATTYYATLQAAFDYAADKTTPTIKVLADIALAAKVTYTNTSKTTVTIDLNGHTVSGALNPLLTLTSASSTGGLIVIKSSVEGGQIRNVVNTNAARACVVLSKGKLRFESGKIYMENKSTSSSVQAYGIQVGSSRTFTMIDGTVEVKSTKHAYAIYSSGTTNIEGGELIVTETKNGYAAGVHVVNGTATISENPTITVSGTKYVNGVRVGGLTPAINSGKTAVTMYNGVANIEGGTYTVTASTNTAYGVYCYGNTFKVDYTTNATLAGNYANGGTANVRGGVFEVTSGGATAYGVCLQTPATIQTALDADGNATYDAATTQPKANITGGKFNVSGASSVGAVNTAAANTDLIVEGGWYNDATNLATKYTAPTKDCNYHVLPLTGKDPYKYEVAEAYTITFNNYDGTPLQSSAVKKGATPAYSGTTPTKAEDESYTYSFTGWSPAITAVSATATYTAQFSSTPRTYDITLNTNGGTINAGNVEHYTVGTGATLPTNVTKSGFTFGGWFDNSELTGDAVTTISTTATGDKQFWAKWELVETGDYLDIVDWTNSTVTVNANGWIAWPCDVNGNSYAKGNRNTDRTLTIPYSGAAGTNLLITVEAGGGVISKRNYPIPFINTIDGTTETSVVYINSGKLTIDGSKTLAAVYVAPGAELEITGSLTVGKLFLRTDNAQSAILTNTGTLTATNVYYTRITRSNATYDQFGLPLNCALSSVTMSNAGKLGGSEMPYGSAWSLLSYDEAERAEYGKKDDGSNWSLLASGGTIKGGAGYQMISTTKYYREYYFPVDFSELTNVVPVSYTEGAAGPDNRGWNIICSPLTSVYTVNNPDPATGMKLNWLEPAGDAYVQEPASTILPARPFAFQTTESCTELVFNNNHSLVLHAPRRVAAADNTETEWLHLDILDAESRGDQTSLYVHPSRFAEAYEAGVDVAKLSFSASHALLYSSHAYGEMAFAGVSDALLENGVALTVYSPKEQELTISMRDNEWLDRMAYVWLIDNETGAQIDLLESDYTFEAAAGTTTGRFILMGRFFAPQIATDIDEVDGEQAKPKKLIIRDKLYILINDQLYDGTGKMVK